MRRELPSREEIISEFANSPIRKFLFDKPLYKFIFLVLFQIVTFYVIDIFPGMIRGVHVFLSILHILIIVYFVLVIVRVAKRSLDYLMSPRHIPALIGAYALFLIAVLILFSTAYDIVQLSGLGHIRYGGCNDEISTLANPADPAISDDYFYFSAITFFTVGYGDICPVGLSKGISIIAAFAGHVVSVILVALIINNYLQKENSRENGKKK